MNSPVRGALLPGGGLHRSILLILCSLTASMPPAGRAFPPPAVSIPCIADPAAVDFHCVLGGRLLSRALFSECSVRRGLSELSFAGATIRFIWKKS